MNLYYYGDERAYVNGRDIFEVTAGETSLLQQKSRTGFDMIYDLLDEIGYYGVRLKRKEELDPFETLVGGLSWCIGYIKPEFNRDIAYSEGMSLGKKISISEKLIICLQQMNYPDTVWPQQIQGMDYRAMEVLLRWLKIQISEIRNSIPAYESLAAQQLFEDSFVFDDQDSPSSQTFGLWFPGQCKSETVRNVLPSLTGSVSFEGSSIIVPCDPRSINTLPVYLESRRYVQSGSFNDDLFMTTELLESVTNTDFASSTVLTESHLSQEERSAEDGQSTDIIQLMRMKQLRLHDIMKMKMKEERRMRQMSELKQKYQTQQEYYRQAETVIQDLVAHENNDETVAKLQELKSLLKLLETLNLQCNSNRQMYKEEITVLNKQVEMKQMEMMHERQQYDLIHSIDQRVTISLTSILSVFRGINLEILQSRCYLERIPSKPELLYFEGEVGQYMDLMVEGSTQLSQCHDMLNNLKTNYAAQKAHLIFLQSLSTVLRKDRSRMQHISRVLIDQVDKVTQQLTRLIQQYNVEMKKRNRILKSAISNQTVVFEKKRNHAKMMQSFSQECENNKALIQRIYELQNRRN